MSLRFNFLLLKALFGYRFCNLITIVLFRSRLVILNTRFWLVGILAEVEDGLLLEDAVVARVILRLDRVNDLNFRRDYIAVLRIV